MNPKNANRVRECTLASRLSATLRCGLQADVSERLVDKSTFFVHTGVSRR